jgi:6-phosphogluconolactonase
MARPSLPLDVRVSATPELVAQTAAREVVALAARAVRTRGSFRLALAGGATPKRLYELLVAGGPADEPTISWAHTQIFFGDERFVPADSADSNFRMAREALLDHVPIPEAAVHRVPTDLADPFVCAARYEVDLRAAFGREGRGWPRFDLILLGMGADGHTASLFPGSRALQETEKLIAATWVDALRGHRITFTLPLINHARAVFFLVTGAEKASSIARVLSPDLDPDPLPAQRVRPKTGRLVWLVDAAAAGRRNRSGT